MSQINFPSSPLNGDTFFANGVFYIYDSTKTIWKVLETGSNFSSNDAQTLEGEAGAFYLNYNNFNNKPNLTGIGASYNQANVAFNQANVGAINSGLAFDIANIAVLTGNSAFNQANLGYDQANIAVVISSSAFNQANLGYDQANLGYTQAGLAFNQSNAAFSISANLNPTYENVTANGNITANGTISAVNFFTNPSSISSNLTISANINAMKIGPISVDNGVYVTIEQNCSLVII